jgi:DNA-binding CsgD family transcriptional regulator
LQVMREIADAMGAHGATLSIHQDDGDKIDVIAAHPAVGLSVDVVRDFLARQCVERPFARDATHHWIDCHIGDLSEALIIPVQRIADHNPLFITVFFGGNPAICRRTAEDVYLRRRPFAIGYFRLWQLERTRHRRSLALESALHRSELGVLLVARDGRIIFENDCAGKLLNAVDGVQRTRGSLGATERRDAIKFDAALGHVIAENEIRGSSGTAPMLAIARREWPPLIVSILPAEQPAEEPADVAAIVYILDPATDTDPLVQPVCKMFKLSPVETRLVCFLVSGRELAEAAREMRVKEQTARGCLKQIFLKTETNRQADLIRLMLSNVLRTTRDIPVEAF